MSVNKGKKKKMKATYFPSASDGFFVISILVYRFNQHEHRKRSEVEGSTMTRQ